MFKPRKEILKDKLVKGGDKPLDNNIDILVELRKLKLSDIEFKESDTNDIRVKVAEKQKVYNWTRLYLTDKIEDIEIGDVINIRYKYSDLSMDLIFGAYDKASGTVKDEDGIVNYIIEDDEKVLCLMVDEDYLTKEEYRDISRIFKRSRFTEYVLVKHEDLIFTNTRTNEILEYYDFSY